jgi:hypothetical protein
MKQKLLYKHRRKEWQSLGSINLNSELSSSNFEHTESSFALHGKSSLFQEPAEVSNRSDLSLKKKPAFKRTESLDSGKGLIDMRNINLSFRKDAHEFSKRIENHVIDIKDDINIEESCEQRSSFFPGKVIGRHH